MAANHLQLSDDDVFVRNVVERKNYLPDNIGAKKHFALPISQQTLVQPLLELESPASLIQFLEDRLPLGTGEHVVIQ